MSRPTGTSSFTLADFELGGVLGRGGFGEVIQAKWKGKNNEKSVAIKKLNSKQRSDQLKKEVENHQKIEHENIVKFLGYFKENDVDYIVMELCPEGSLRDYVRNNEMCFSSAQAVSIMRQLVNAIQHLHKNGICHRDLTAGNVLINRIQDTGEKAKFKIKVCDFGLAKTMKPGHAAQTVAGTPGYMDPRVTDRNNYGKEVDIYSLGCVLYFMLTGHEPRPGEKSRFPKLDELDDDAIELITSLTDSNVARRMQLDKITKSPFMLQKSTADHPTSFHSRRSIERRISIDQPSIRERSKSRGAVRDRNRSPSAPSRQICRSRSSSHVPPVQRTKWPLNFDRLATKKEEKDGYRLDIVNVKEAKLTAYEGRSNAGRLVMTIYSDGRSQEVKIFPNDRSSSQVFHSIDELYDSHLRLYKTVVRLLDDIRWKVAKVIFNNSSFCKDGVIRLMENGDLRIKDSQGNYSVNANTDDVYAGDPKNPIGLVTNKTKREQILKYRDLAKGTEELMERLGFEFPYISYDIGNDTKTVTRNAREAMRESNQIPVSAGIGERNATSREVSRVSRARSTYSHMKKPSSDTALINYSAPVGSMQQYDKENVPRKLTYSITPEGKVVAVKIDEISLRVSSNNPNQYIYLGPSGREQRFTFIGDDYKALTEDQSYLMRKLRDRMRAG